MAEKKLVLTKEEIRRAITPRYSEFKSLVFNEVKKSAERRHRVLVILSGDNAKKMGILTADLLIHFIRRAVKRKTAFTKEAGIRILYIFHDEFDDAVLRERIAKRLIKRYVKRRKLEASLEIGVYENSERYLGTTYQALVMDLTHCLKPNDVGRLIGIVEGGGIVVLQVPRWKEWPERENLFQMMLTVPQYPKPRRVFAKWFQNVTLDCDGVFIYDVDDDETIKATPSKSRVEKSKGVEIPSDTLFDRKLYELALTQDQVNAIKVLENIVKKPRKRISIVLIANRGRGKSCAIGIALAGIIKELLKVKHRIRIGVTAPEPLNVQALMNMAMKSLEVLGMKYKVVKRKDMIIELQGERFSIEYWEPMVLSRIDVDIAVVDEAAGIPVPLLHEVWKNHRRSVFASTIHGYEGAGRGFSIRFLKRLKEDPSTELYMYEMEEPIRYGREDPVERWQFRVLLLDAEPDELTKEDLEYIERKEFVYLKPKPEELFTLENEKLLRSIFGIYVQAHYRNEPDDLGMMADAPHHSIRALMLPTGKIVASAQLAEEGPIPEDYIDSLLRGGKIPGNIIPDRLLKHHRLRDFAHGRGWRIVRIAVHPSVQGRGIGSYLLKKLEEEARERNHGWIGSGFGATEELLRFWIKNGFIPLHISPNRNPVSAEYTVLVLKPLKERWSKLVEIANREFRRKILESLHDTYRDLEDGVALLLLNTFFGEEECDNGLPPLTKIQVDRLLSYYLGYMTYESCSDIMELLAKHYFSQHPKCRAPLNEFQERILIVRTLQGHSWERTANILRKKKFRVIDEVRKIASEFLKFYYGVEKKSADKYIGITTLHDYVREPMAKKFTHD